MHLGPGQKPIVMSKYPHMMPLDAEVWGKYLAEAGDTLSEVWYDVHVGQGMLGAGVGSVRMQKVSQGVSRKRIDVVAAVAQGFWVIEVKPWASMQAVGQVLCYTRLFMREYEVAGAVRPVIICDRADEDLLESYDQFGVGVIAMEELPG